MTILDTCQDSSRPKMVGQDPAASLRHNSANPELVERMLTASLAVAARNAFAGPVSKAILTPDAMKIGSLIHVTHHLALLTQTAQSTMR